MILFDRLKLHRTQRQARTIFWLCQKRLSKGRFRYWPTGNGAGRSELFAHELHVLLAGGDPAATRAMPPWRPIVPAMAA